MNDGDDDQSFQTAFVPETPKLNHSGECHKDFSDLTIFALARFQHE